MIDYNAYNGPKMTREQMDAYLARIGVKEPVTLNLKGLTRIHQAHQQTVPFENLDILADKPLPLDHEALFDKIVTRRRGGRVRGAQHHLQLTAVLPGLYPGAPDRPGFRDAHVLL